MGKITPPYRTPAEFVSDLWLLFKALDSSSEVNGQNLISV